MEKHSDGTPVDMTNRAERFGKRKGGRPVGTGGVPRQLLDMRHVYRTEKEGGEFLKDTPGQKINRALCRENPQQFLALMNKLEAEVRAKRAKQQAGAKVAVAGPSPGTGELVALIDRLFDDFEGGVP